MSERTDLDEGRGNGDNSRQAMSRSYLIPRTFIGSVMLLATAHGEPVMWPPEHMRDLPADYLEQLRTCMIAGAARMDRLHAKDSRDKESIGWVRYGRPTLSLGSACLP